MKKKLKPKTNKSWFPLHMQKSLLFIEKNLSQIDIVLEIVDARLPLSSRNEEILRLTKMKKRVVVLSKKDLANADEVEKWIHYFKKSKEWRDLKKGALNRASNEASVSSLALNIKSTSSNNLLASLKRIFEKEFKSKSWFNKRAVRVLVVGVPNVGKSTLINKLVDKKKAKVGDSPGITKSLQIIKVASFISLIDTPGALGELSNKQKFYLSVIGTVKEKIYDATNLAETLIDYLLLFEAEIFNKYFSFIAGRINNEQGEKDWEEKNPRSKNPTEWLVEYAQQRNFKQKIEHKSFSQAGWDLNRAANDLLHRLRKEKNFSWEKVSQVERLSERREINAFFSEEESEANAST